MNWNLSDNLFGFHEADTPGARLYRRAFELFIAVATLYLAWEWGQYTLRISDVVLPLGLARIVDISFMHGNQLPVWNAVLIGAFTLAGFLRAGKPFYSLAFALLLLQYAARFSLGEIPHSANLIGLGLLGYALAAWFFPDRTARERFGLGFSYFFLGLAYTFAAVSKITASGITWPDGRHLWMWINEKAVDEIARSGIVELNWIQEMALESLVVATLFLAFGLVAELFAWLVWFRKTRYFIIWAIMGLHIGIWLTMDILFILSIYELLILGLPWPLFIDYVLKKTGRYAD